MAQAPTLKTAPVSVGGTPLSLKTTPFVSLGGNFSFNGTILGFLHQTPFFRCLHQGFRS